MKSGMSVLIFSVLVPDMTIDCSVQSQIISPINITLQFQNTKRYIVKNLSRTVQHFNGLLDHIMKRFHWSESIKSTFKLPLSVKMVE